MKVADNIGISDVSLLRHAVLPKRRVFLVRRYRRLAKRALDVSVCLLLMPVTLPVMAACALAIYLENRGAVLFRQERTGRGGRTFQFLKFRTMVVNAEELKEQLEHLNELTPPDFKITNDPRVTRIGRLLRKTSLDELPQLLNVLRGEMSLVGPRPTSFDPHSYELWQTERLEVLPGITGLWQISGRSDVDFEDRARLDIEYIQRQSLWLDLQILIRTIPAVLSGRGAC